MRTNFTKQFTSNTAILKLLVSRGLLICDLAKSENILDNIGYYRFSAYLHPFIKPPKDKGMFKSGCRFEDALNLYSFDKKLRILLFNEIEKIEIAFRGILANVVAESIGDIFWMTSPSSYANVQKYVKTKALIDKEYLHSTEDFISHFKNKYADPYPPAWMLVEILPFGVLTRIYKNLADNSLRKRIVARFGLSTPVFESWMTVITLTRNACCHHARVWNKEHPISPMRPKKTSHPWLTLWPANRTYLNICILKYFLNIISPQNDMRRHLQDLLNAYPNIDIAAMGFPENWQDEPLWR